MAWLEWPLQNLNSDYKWDLIQKDYILMVVNFQLLSQLHSISINQHEKNTIIDFFRRIKIFVLFHLQSKKEQKNLGHVRKLFVNPLTKPIWQVI